jgi:hypothetical protein
VDLLQVRASAREEPERPAHEVIDPLMLAVWAQRTGQSPLTVTVGTFWTEVARSHDGPAFLANHLERLALFANACLRALILLFISVCNMWVRIRSEGQGAYGAFAKLGRDTLELDYVRILFRSKPILSGPEELVANVVMGRF